jgi:hypothetical protein
MRLPAKKQDHKIQQLWPGLAQHIVGKTKLQITNDPRCCKGKSLNFLQKFVDGSLNPCGY